MKRNALQKLYFVEPKSNADADELAQRLIELSNVQEIYLTDAKYGYAVKARFFDNKGPNDAVKYISSNISGKFGKVTRQI